MEKKKRKNPRLRDPSLPHHTGRAVKCQLQKKEIVREKTREIAPSRKTIFFIYAHDRALCFSLVAGQGLLQLQLPLVDSRNLSSAQQPWGPNLWLFLQHCKTVPAWHKMLQWEILPLLSQFSQPRCTPMDASTAPPPGWSQPLGSPVCQNPYVNRPKLKMLTSSYPHWTQIQPERAKSTRNQMQGL